MQNIHITICLEDKEQINLHTQINTEDLFDNNEQEFIIDKCDNNNGFIKYIRSFSESVTGRVRKPIKAIFQFYTENDKLLREETEININNIDLPDNLCKKNEIVTDDVENDDFFFKNTIITIKLK